MDDSASLGDDVVHLARALLAGDQRAAVPAVRRVARRQRTNHPEVAAELISLLRLSPLRSVGSAIAELPLDTDSRLPLVVEAARVVEEVPILPPEVSSVLTQLVAERRSLAALAEAGLGATRTALFTGPPGVGKTMAARWLASELEVPLLTLDLSSVMSSYLGRTGANLKRVLDYAQQRNCILLIDEMDAVAKRRDDSADLGELKRLVTVLLQEIDAWPDGPLLVAATNHAELLDPAVWRRFEVTTAFPMPDAKAMEALLVRLLGEDDVDMRVLEVVATAFEGESFSTAEQFVLRARRRAALSRQAVADELLAVSAERYAGMSRSQRIGAAVTLMDRPGASQRAVSAMTGVSRDTLRKHRQGPANSGG